MRATEGKPGQSVSWPRDSTVLSPEPMLLPFDGVHEITDVATASLSDAATGFELLRIYEFRDD